MCQPVYWSPDRFLSRVRAELNPTISESQPDQNTDVLVAAPVSQRVEFKEGVVVDLVVVWADITSLARQWHQHEGWLRQAIGRRKNILIFPYSGLSYTRQYQDRLATWFSEVKWFIPDIGEFPESPFKSSLGVRMLVDRLANAGILELR